MKVIYVKYVIISVICFGLSSSYAADQSITFQFPILDDQEPVVVQEIPVVEVDVTMPEIVEVELPKPVPVVVSEPEVPVKDTQITTDQAEQAFEEYDELCAQIPARQPSAFQKIISNLWVGYDLAKDFGYKKYLAIKYWVTSWLNKDNAEVSHEPQT